MSNNSKINWTQATWNCVTGCTKVSLGCQHCYAEVLTKRLQAMGQQKYAHGFDVITMHENVLQLPLTWRKSRLVFVNSMSDLFHAEVSEDFITRVFDVMQQAHWHKFQVLTKRSERLAEIAETLPWPSNIWMGVTIENADYLHRMDDLRNTGAAVKFLSLEPLLGPLPNMDLTGIDWVITGGESGPNARPVDQDWVGDIRDQCLSAGVPFFFKQWGGRNKKKAGRLLDGVTWDEMPVICEECS